MQFSALEMVGLVRYFVLANGVLPDMMSAEAGDVPTQVTSLHWAPTVHHEKNTPQAAAGPRTIGNV